MLCGRILTLTAPARRLKSFAATVSSLQHFDDIPSAKGLPVFGTTLEIIAKGSSSNLHNYVDQRHKQLGPIFKEKIGPVNCVFISDPDVMRSVFAHEGKYPLHLHPEAWTVYNQLYGCSRGLFFMDGTRWRHHRKIMNRLLLKGDFEWIETSCEPVCNNLIEHIRSVSKTGGEYPNIESTLYKWSLDILVSVLLGAESYKKLRNALELDLLKLASTVHLVFQTTEKLALIPASLAAKFNIPRWRRFVVSVTDALTGANNLVSKLIANIDPNSDGFLAKLLMEEIERDDINRIIADLVLAAGDTTSYAMEWLLYLVGKNGDSQQELRQNPEFAKYYLRESLRLYPVAPFLTRILPENTILCGYEVPKHTIIIMSIYTSGRDERYFKEPQEFRPCRWIRESNKDYHSGMQKASLPFAMGLRSCIGKKIAETQMQMTLVKIVNNFSVEVCNKKDVEMTLKLIAVPKQKIRFRFKAL